MNIHLHNGDGAGAGHESSKRPRRIAEDAVASAVDLPRAQNRYIPFDRLLKQVSLPIPKDLNILGDPLELDLGHSPLLGVRVAREVLSRNLSRFDECAGARGSVEAWDPLAAAGNTLCQGSLRRELEGDGSVEVARLEDLVRPDEGENHA